MKTWDYKVVELPLKGGAFSGPKADPQELTSALVPFGAEGWELVQVVALQVNGWTNHLLATFKRETGLGR